MKFFYYFLILALSFTYLTGCGDGSFPTPQEIIKQPIGPDSIKRGMPKDRVKDLWGEPDEVSYEEIADNGQTRFREVWVYRKWAGMIPVDADYLSKTKYVYFDGSSVTNITETPLKQADTSEE